MRPPEVVLRLVTVYVWPTTPPANQTTVRDVVFDGNERHRGQLMDVRIERAGLFTLYGDPAIVNL